MDAWTFTALRLSLELTYYNESPRHSQSVSCDFGCPCFASLLTVLASSHHHSACRGCIAWSTARDWTSGRNGRHPVPEPREEDPREVRRFHFSYFQVCDERTSHWSTAWFTISVQCESRAIVLLVDSANFCLLVWPSSCILSGLKSRSSERTLRFDGTISFVVL